MAMEIRTYPYLASIKTPKTLTAIVPHRLIAFNLYVQVDNIHHQETQLYRVRYHVHRKQVKRVEIIKHYVFNSLRPSDAYMRQWSNHRWFR